MRRRLLRSGILVSVSLLLATSAVAQQQRSLCESEDQAKRELIAELKELRGNVLVSNKDGVSSAVAGQRVQNKARVTTTSNAGVLVSFDCGCDVRLKENERIDIELPRGCGALLAAVQGVPVGAALGATGAVTTGAAAVNTAGLLSVGAIGAGGYAQFRNSRNVNPNYALVRPPVAPQ